MITVNDLVLHYSLDATETDTGGGAMSSVAIPDNTVENVFRNISRVDRVRGDIQLQRIWFRLKSGNVNALKDAIAYLDNQPQDPKTYVSLIRTNLERRNEVLEKIIPPDLAADADYPIITVILNETFAADAVELTVYAPKNSGITGGTESSLKRAFLWIQGHEPYEIAYSSPVNQTMFISGYQGLCKKITLVLKTGLHSAITASEPASVQAYISTKDGGNSIPGVNVVGCTNLTSPAAAGELSVDVKDVTTKIAPTIISRAVRSGTHTQPDATLQDIQEQSDITYQEYNGGSYHNHLGDVFSGGGLYPFANFTAPVKSGTFCILNANGTRFDSPAQGHWKSERAAENTYYSSDGTAATLISGDDYDVIFAFLTSGYKPVALLNRAAGVISRLALNADNPATIPLEAYGRVWMSQIYNETSDFRFPDNLFRFSAYTDLGQGRIEKQCQALPNAGALTGYSAVLPAGTKLDTLRLVYIREHNGFRYEYQSGAIEELFSDRRVLHGPDTSYIGHFSGMTRLNAFPPKHFALNGAAGYEPGFTDKAVIAEMETGEYTLTLTADGGNASISDVILSYDVMMDVTYVPIPKLIVILLEGSGVLSPESLSLSYQSEGVQKNAVSDSAGIISGHGSGTFVTDQYRIEFTPSALPDDGRLSFLYKESIETNDDGRKSTLPMISADDIIIIKDGSNEELALVDAVNHSSNRVYLKGPLLHSYSSGALAAGVLTLGDLYAQASAPEFYASWDPDDWVGSETPNDGNFNFVDYPLELSNAGCVEEDWIIEFTSTAEFNVTGRSRGIVGTGDITSDTAVAYDGSTYFILRFAGFSGAWQVGEGFSFHTYGNTASMWCIRGVQHGSSLSGTDSVKLIYGGDV